MATVANIGDIEIIAVTDGDAAPVDPAWPFPRRTGRRLGETPDSPLTTMGGIEVISARLCFDLKSETVLIDTGLGPGSWEDSSARRQMQDTCSIACPRSISVPGSITCVVMTHIHFDHVGWNVTSSESDSPTPMFPKARYLAPEADWRPLERQYGPIQRSPSEGVPGQA